MSDLSFPKGFLFRKAAPSDVDDIHDLIYSYALDHVLLPRTKEDLSERIGNFHVIEYQGIFAGCVALRNYGGNLYEVRSLAIKKDFVNQHLGSAMVASLLEMLKSSIREPVRVFALTYRENFFRHLGFHTVEKELFPEKIWSDCSICDKKHCCDEIAVLLELSGTKVK